jgi:glucose-1-phosphate adenylyltransferase
MRAKKVIAMLLAGGQGSRLGVLTQKTAKPAVPYGGKYRIIDFPLSNCTNSDIDTVGVLTQYRPLELNRYIGNGGPWDLNRNHGGVFVLPPYAKGETGEWYSGTANAIYQNSDFIDQYSPQYVVILSGDHIYKMDYAAMLKSHEERKADATIAVLPVSMEEASRFGIMNTDAEGRITEFEEKPKVPKSNKASMGIYIFTWEVLRRYLAADDENPESHNDFGRDIIPAMIANGQRLFAYNFSGYWKDVGTIESLWQANMDLLEDPPVFNLYDTSWRIYSRNEPDPGHYVDSGATVTRSIVTEGAEIYGHVTHSVIFAGAVIEQGAVVTDSIIMPRAHIGKNARIFKAIIGEDASVGENSSVGEIHAAQEADEKNGITVVGEQTCVPVSTHLPRGAMIARDHQFDL